MQGEEAYIARLVAQGHAHICECGTVIVSSEDLPRQLANHRRSCGAQLEREAIEAGTPAQLQTMRVQCHGGCGREYSQQEWIDNGRRCTTCNASAVELAAKQARELAQDIGLDADDAAGLERAVRESAAEFDADARARCSELVEKLATELDRQQADIDADVDAMIAEHKATELPSVLDELAAALRDGGILTMGASSARLVVGNHPAPEGVPQTTVHAIIETDDGGRFAQCKGRDVLGVLLELVSLWKEAKPKPAPLCLFCSAPLEGVLVGQHLNVGHSVPLCVAFGTERTRMSCVPPHAMQQLLAAELRKRKAVKA